MNQFEKALWESQDIQRQHMQDMSRYESGYLLSEMNRKETVDIYREAANNIAQLSGDIFKSILGI